MRYPSAVDYTLALQHPAAAFADPGLRGAVFTKGLLGPEGIAGSSAVVFRAAIGGTDYALRCYTREDASSPERYAAVDTYVADARLSRYVGTVTWFDREVLVKGSRWPVLTMEWIDGRHLNEYVGYLADEGNVTALRTLAGRWLALVDDLQQARFAHGDLQHGNILVDAGSHFRLVDFDSVWIPPLQGQPAPTETGHPSYQPHHVTAAGRWGPYMDTFPGLLIYLALTALAKAPGLWGKLNNGDNLLFERGDLAPPHDTEVWTLLKDLADPEIDRLAAKLREFCLPGRTASTTLREAIRPETAGREAPAQETTRLDMAQRQTVRPKQNWWELTGTAPARPGGPVTAPVPSRPAVPAFEPAAGPPRPFKPVHTQVVYSEPALPAPPAAPYLTTIASQAPVQARQDSARRGPGSTGTWWEPGSATGPAFTSTQVLVGDPALVSATASKRRAAPAVQRGFGAVFILVGLTGCAVLAAKGFLVPGIALGAVLVIIGFLLIMLRPKGRAR